MQKSKPKLANTIITILCTAALVLLALKMTGVFDITSLFPSRYVSISDSKNGRVIDEWESEPFGDLGITMTVTSYDNGYIWVTPKANSENFEYSSSGEFYTDSVKKNISEINYIHLEVRKIGYDTEKHREYGTIVLPLDCEKVVFDGEESIPQSGVLHTSNEDHEFKIYTLTYDRAPEMRDVGGFFKTNHKLVLIDKEGNEHSITEVYG